METRDSIIRRVCKTMSYQDVLDDIMARSEAECERLDTDRMDRAEAKRIAQGWARATSAPLTTPRKPQKQEAKMKLTDAAREGIKERYERGESINAIAKDLGIAWETANNAAKDGIAPQDKAVAEPVAPAPAVWNAHRCPDAQDGWQIKRLDDGRAVMTADGEGFVVRVNACPWCGVRLDGGQ